MILHGVKLGSLTVLVVTNSDDLGWRERQALFEQDAQSFFKSIVELEEVQRLSREDPNGQRLAELCEKYMLRVDQLENLTLRSIFASENPLDDDTD